MTSVKRLFFLICLILVVGIGATAFLVKYAHRKPATVPVKTPEISGPVQKLIGKSVERRDISSYTYGGGQKHLVFVGGIHGGYEWNSVSLAYEFMDYLAANPNATPQNVRVTVIPSLNPDAVYKVTGKEGRFAAADVTKDVAVLESARFNAHDVDLNRNFDCKWKPTSMWKSKVVNAGSAAHSEPETQALVNFALENRPDMFLFWHSKASAVYASFCEDGILPATDALYKAYGVASGYKAEEAFTSYEISGDAGAWLAKMGIPAISVELTTHEDTDFERNLKGIGALFEYFGK